MSYRFQIYKMKRNQKRSSNVEFDVFEAFRSAIEFEEKEDIFINPAMTRFIEVNLFNEDTFGS